MIYRPIGEFVNLEQGLAINKKTNHLVYKNTKNDGGIPLLKIKDMILGEYGNTFIDKSVSKHFIATPDDIIYTRTGQPGLAFRGFYGVVHNNCFKVNLISPKVDKNYLFQVLNSDFFIHQLKEKINSSMQADVTHSIFKSLLIPVLPLNLQRKIGTKFLIIDKKMSKNEAIIKTLINKIKEVFYA